MQNSIPKNTKQSVLVFWLILLFIKVFDVFAESTPPASVGAFRMSLLSAFNKQVMVSGTLTALRPFDLSMGVFNNVWDGYFLKSGFSLPWKSESDDFTSGFQREIFFLGGYRFEEPGTVSNQFGNTPPKENVHSLTLDLGIEVVDWLNQQLGLEFVASVGTQFLLNVPKSRSALEPLLDLSVGIVF